MQLVVEVVEVVEVEVEVEVVVVVVIAVVVVVVIAGQYLFFPYALPLASAGVGGYVCNIIYLNDVSWEVMLCDAM